MEKNIDESIDATEIIPDYELCRVGAEFSRTINLGSFESVKIGVSIQMPCRKSEVKKMQRKVMAMTAERIEKEVRDFKP